MEDLSDYDIDELYNLKSRLEERLEKYFGDDQRFTGDEGYQDLLCRLEDVEEEIDNRELKNNESNMNNLMNFDQFSLNEKKKPSAGLSKEKKSEIVKKAKKGEDIGKKGKNFDIVAKKAAKKYGEDRGKKIAAASMWKNIPR